MLFIESYAFFFCLIKHVCLYGGLIHNMETKIWTQVRGCATTPYKAIQTSKTSRRNLKKNVGFFCTGGGESDFVSINTDTETQMWKRKHSLYLPSLVCNFQIFAGFGPCL